MMSDIESLLGPAYQGRRFLRVAELIELGLVDNRQTLSTWIAAGHFPAPLRIGPRVLLFPVAEILEMLKERAAERQQIPEMKGPDGLRETVRAECVSAKANEPYARIQSEASLS
jgi:predicted DNA-binding transcriptional regulator AlpA